MKIRIALEHKRYFPNHLQMETEWIALHDQKIPVRQGVTADQITWLCSYYHVHEIDLDERTRTTLDLPVAEGFKWVMIPQSVYREVPLSETDTISPSNADIGTISTV